MSSLANQDPHSGDEAALRRGIAVRKALDLGFAMLGLSLVLASLSVLVVLFGQLVVDGSARLFSSHEVKTNSFAPGRFELVGTLRREGSATAPAWALVRDPLVITNAADLAEASQLP